MTTKTRFFLIAFMLPLALSAQWNYQSTPVTYQSYLEVMSDDTAVYSYGNTGEIYRTVNGGADWSFFDLGMEYSWIYDFDFPSGQIGYGCGGTYFGIYADVIIKTENAGLTWDTLSTNNFGIYVFEHIKFLNVDTGFVAASHQLFRTVDGGENFSAVNFFEQGVLNISNLSANPAGVLFVSTSELDAQDGYHISIFRSDNVGETWQEVYATNMNNNFINAIHFPSIDVGYAVGSNGIFLKTTDAGMTWNESFISPLTNLTTVQFTSENEGYTNSTGGIWKTVDSGLNWSAQNIDFPSIINYIQFGSGEVGYAIGNEHIYKTTNGGEILSIDAPEVSINIKVYPNPSSNKLKIQFDEDIAIRQLELMDTNGKMVKSFPNQLTELNLSGLASGVYILKILTDQGVVSKRIVVE